MKVGAWYQQTFPEKTIYFLVIKQQKNGGFAGIQVDYYLGSKPHKKHSSIPNTPHNKLLWSIAVNIPDCVKSVIPSDNG